MKNGFHFYPVQCTKMLECLSKELGCDYKYIVFVFVTYLVFSSCSEDNKYAMAFRVYLSHIYLPRGLSRYPIAGLRRACMDRLPVVPMQIRLRIS